MVNEVRQEMFPNLPEEEKVRVEPQDMIVEVDEEQTISHDEKSEDSDE